LLKYVEEFKKHVAIAGFRDVQIRNVEELLHIIHKEKSPKVDIQFFDAAFVATWQHLYFSVLNALTALENKRNISNTLAMETLLYASAQRQIKSAMKLLGISSNSSKIALIIIGEDSKAVDSTLTKISKMLNAKRDDDVLELTDRKVKTIREIFEISNREIKTVRKKTGLDKEALINLVIERMALLATQR